MLSLFIAFGLFSNLIDNYGLIYNLTQGAFISLFSGCCLYLYFRLIERSYHKREAAQKLPLKTMILWRILFWLGVFALIVGVGVNSVRSQDFIFVSLAVIFLGFGLMVVGVLISQGRLLHKSNNVAS